MRLNPGSLVPLTLPLIRWFLGFLAGAGVLLLALVACVFLTHNR